ncbi:MAG TPA: GGDEF domain-containing protein [Methylococcaceae bacterium]|nr:GGDEF domain-containing protein [Methylococcaceae bacterium]
MTDAATAPHNILESVIRLTEQRDQHSLETCLIQTMLELTGACRITLYVPEEDETNEPPNRLVRVAHVRDPSLCACPDGEEGKMIFLNEAPLSYRACLESGKSADIAGDDRQVHIHPVIGAENRPAGILCVDHRRGRSLDIRLIDSFLRIYRNYLELLNENQHDRLTGLLNRKTFDERVVKVIEQARGLRQRAGDRGFLALAIVDIDHFKRINDSFGHLYGDEVLLLFARLMTQIFREDDLLFRFGGEEFVILLKTPDAGVCAKILNRFRAAVEGYAFPLVGTVTTSIGYTEISGEIAYAPLLDRADRALYFAKRQGRNRVHRYEQLIEEGKILPAEVPAGSVDLF